MRKGSQGRTSVGLLQSTEHVHDSRFSDLIVRSVKPEHLLVAELDRLLLRNDSLCAKLVSSRLFYFENDALQRSSRPTSCCQFLLAKHARPSLRRAAQPV